MGRGLSRYTLLEKKAIVREAYEQPGRLYATAKKYHVDLRNIKNWRKLLDVEQLKNCQKMHRPVSSVQVEHQDVYEHLLHYYEVERERSVPVSVSMLIHESLRYGMSFDVMAANDVVDFVQIFWQAILLLCVSEYIGS